MIKANELRIGNWLMDGRYFSRIVGRDIDDIQYERCGTHVFDPIPLTPEILQKAGFEVRKHTEDGTIYGILNFTIIHALSVNDGIKFFLNGYHNDVVIEYVHQLQNLYFAITGEELNINL